MTGRPSTLLVEDDKDFAAELLAALGARGLQLDHATEWRVGLELFRVNGYELVIADYNLPDTEHGLKLLAKMKAAMSSTKLVLISGALTPSAERSLGDLSLLDGYYSKRDNNLTAHLAKRVEEANERAMAETDWSAVGAGFVSNVDRDIPELARIDDLLRADVEQSG